ncbi:Uncharacterised protein [Mycobacteroides abscessus subsp. abscessus]|nr:Uncharacterised protein [Mycobacteroides abscessus subsp. abscessus]
MVSGNNASVPAAAHCTPDSTARRGTVATLPPASSASPAPARATVPASDIGVVTNGPRRSLRTEKPITGSYPRSEAANQAPITVAAAMFGVPGTPVRPPWESCRAAAAGCDRYHSALARARAVGDG